MLAADNYEKESGALAIKLCIVTYSKCLSWSFLNFPPLLMLPDYKNRDRGFQALDQSSLALEP